MSDELLIRSHRPAEFERARASKNFAAGENSNTPLLGFRVEVVENSTQVMLGGTFAWSLRRVCVYDMTPARARALRTGIPRVFRVIFVQELRLPRISPGEILRQTRARVAEFRRLNHMRGPEANSKTFTTIKNDGHRLSLPEGGGLARQLADQEMKLATQYAECFPRCICVTI